MNFYIATDPETGRKIWGKRQDEAKRVDRNFEKRDINPSQDVLIGLFQEYEDRIHALKGEPGGPGAAEEGSTPSLPQPIDGEVAVEPSDQPLLSEPHRDAGADPAPGSAATDGLMALNATQLAPIALDVIERVGELGEDAFEALDQHQERNGVSGQFSRGVHVLSVLSMGEHQLSRLFFAARKAKKWGGA